MTHHDTKTGYVHLEETVHDPLVTNQKPPDVEESDSPGDAVTKPSLHDKGHKIEISYLLLLIPFVIPLGFLIYWIIHAAVNQPDWLSGKGNAIGGNLNYIEAKGIDFVCGAVLAPALMAALDMLWFSKARITVVNEKTSRGLPLNLVLQTSGTSQGGFNVLKLFMLVKERTCKLSLMASLILLSGLSGKMLANFIAYEAVTDSAPASNSVPLRLMNRGLDISDGFFFANLSISEQSSLANQISALLTGLNFESAVSMLDNEGGYVGMNATQASLNALDVSFVNLTNVSGYRLSVDCHPGLPSSFSATTLPPVALYIIANCTDSVVNASCDVTFQSQIPGTPSFGVGMYENSDSQYVGFNIDNYFAFLGVLSSWDFMNTSSPSAYGLVPAGSFNMTAFGFQTTKSMSTTWGIICGIYRQEGFLNLSRQLGQPGQPWHISSSSFSVSKTLVKSYLSDWQTALNYQAPSGAIPGIGPPLAWTAGSLTDSISPGVGGTFNWTIYALNFLYASGEAQRISFEIAASNTSTDPADFDHVSASVTLQLYRIVYIPALLLLGLLGLIGATAVTAAMMWHSRDSHSSKIGREVDTLRLLVDSAAGLHGHAAMLAEVAEKDKDELKKWADKFKVRYCEVMEDGRVSIRLERSSIGIDEEEIPLKDMGEDS